MRTSHVVLLLVATVSATRAGAQAVRWQPISFGEPAMALDTTSLAKSPEGFPRATLMLTYAQPRGGGIKLVARKLEVVDFDCPSRQLRRKESTTFDPEGELVDSLPRSVTQPWSKVTTGTDDEVELTAFCRTTFAHR